MTIHSETYAVRLLFYPLTQKITGLKPDYNYQNHESNQIIRHGNQRWLCKHCNRTFIFIPPTPLEPWQRKKAQKGVKSKR